MVSIGSFPVIHSSSLSFLGTTDALTNDPAIGAAVVRAVQAGLTGTPCAAPVAGVTLSPRHAVTVRVQQPFAALGVAGRRGRLRGVRQVAFLLRGASITCRGRAVQSVPLLGSKLFRFAALRCAGRLAWDMVVTRSLGVMRRFGRIMRQRRRLSARWRDRLDESP